MKLLLLCAVLVLSLASAFAAEEGMVRFDARTVRNGKWSNPSTWAGARLPKAGDSVQIQAGHSVMYDLNSSNALRIVHVAGKLAFDRLKSTRLDVAC